MKLFLKSWLLVLWYFMQRNDSHEFTTEHLSFINWHEPFLFLLFWQCIESYWTHNITLKKFDEWIALVNNKIIFEILYSIQKLVDINFYLFVSILLCQKLSSKAFPIDQHFEIFETLENISINYDRSKMK